MFKINKKEERETERSCFESRNFLFKTTNRKRGKINVKIH